MRRSGGGLDIVVEFRPVLRLPALYCETLISPGALQERRAHLLACIREKAPSIGKDLAEQQLIEQLVEGEDHWDGRKKADVAVEILQPKHSVQSPVVRRKGQRTRLAGLRGNLSGTPAKSREVGCFLGLKPGRRNSGKSEPQKGISKEGDRYLRTMMVQGAHYILGPFGEDSDLRRWGRKLAERGGKNGKKRAVVAVARKLAILLHRLWVSGEVYEPLRNSHRAVQAVA